MDQASELFKTNEDHEILQSLKSAGLTGDEDQVLETTVKFEEHMQQLEEVVYSVICLFICPWNQRVWQGDEDQRARGGIHSVVCLFVPEICRRYGIKRTDYWKQPSSSRSTCSSWRRLVDCWWELLVAVEIFSGIG